MSQYTIIDKYGKRTRQLKIKRDLKIFPSSSVSAEHEHLAQKRVEARFIHHKEKKVITEEKSCLWMDN